MSIFSRKKVTLPPELHERATFAARKAGYASLEEFVSHVLEREITRIEGGENPPEDKDIQAVTRRLEGLGYLG